jgi:Cu(I)/Ag(I) efflux system membrane protein CusA/SilA
VIQKVGWRSRRPIQKMPDTRSVLAERVAGWLLSRFRARPRQARALRPVHRRRQHDGDDRRGRRQPDHHHRGPAALRRQRSLRARFSRGLDALKRVLLPLPSGQGQIPMAEIAEVKLVEGPSMIRDENGLLSGYVYVDFDTSKVDVGSYVERAKRVVAAP